MTLSPRHYPTVILVACLGSLASALTAQFVFGLRPCILCLYQRGPYVVAALLSAVALLPMLSARARWGLVGLCALAFIVNTGIAAFHVGVERHWWAGTDACTGETALPTSPDQMLAMLKGPPPPRCDDVPWALFGISMAGFNVGASLVLAGFSGWAARRMKEMA